MIAILSAEMSKGTFSGDNGKEFASHTEIRESVGIDCIFAKPCYPWERGFNQHLNGLVRQCVLKKTDFATMIMTKYI